MSIENIVDKVSETLVRAATTYRPDKLEACRRAISSERNPQARWMLEQMLENAAVAQRSKKPLCDDTGIPHLFLEVGGGRSIDGKLLGSIHKGVIEGLRALPGRPMAVKGDEVQRLEQSAGLDEDPGMLEMAPINIRYVEEDKLRVHILMQGGGPEIRGKTYRVFHKHQMENIVDEILNWATEGAGLLGCTPCIPTIGIGRSHYEAASLMLEAMVFGNCNNQSDIEQAITERLNETQVGPLGLGGDITALATFLKVGPQRASGVRIVSLRLSCLVEPRVASVDL